MVEMLWYGAIETVQIIIIIIIIILKRQKTYTKRISLLPGDLSAPRCRAAFLGQRFRNGDKNEEDV